MEENKKLTPVQTIEAEIGKIDDKSNRIYFFVLDSKGSPNGYLSYIYETAFQLKEMGYNVHMLHQEDEFVGVASWLGDKYAEIPHHNIAKEEMNVSPADVLFIPEFYSNVMLQTKKMPCKRVAIMQNFEYATQVIPVGATWANFGIKDCIATTDSLANRVKEVFPYVNTRVVAPVVPSYFCEPTEPKKLVVNIVAKEQTDINMIVKPFYWKYPMYKWVAFRDLRNVTKTEYAKALKEAAFTVWVDTKTEFGYTAVEAMRCRSILIAKVPEHEPEWMLSTNDKGEVEYSKNAVYFFNMEDVHSLIAGGIEAFITDKISEDSLSEMKKMDYLYTEEEFQKNIIKIYVDDIFAKHRAELVLALDAFKKE